MSETTQLQGRIGNTAYVDLTDITKSEQLESITEISNTAAVLVSETLAGVVTKIPMFNVGQVVKVPEGKKVVIRAGMEELSGQALENGKGNPGDILLLIGQTEITSVPTRVGYDLIVCGTIVAPHAAQDVISPAITHLAGQALYYRGNSARMFLEETSFDREFFELLPEPVALVVVNDVTIETDVTKEVFVEKVADVIVVGEIRVPGHLKSVVQALTRTHVGSITVFETEDDNV